MLQLFTGVAANTDYGRVYSAQKAMGGGVTLDLIHEGDYLIDLFGAPEECCNLRGQFPTGKSILTICRFTSPLAGIFWVSCTWIILAAHTGGS